MGFMRRHKVLVLNSVRLFVSLSKLVIFLIFGLWKVNVVQIFLSFLLVFFVVDFV